MVTTLIDLLCQSSKRKELRPLMSKCSEVFTALCKIKKVSNLPTLPVFDSLHLNLDIFSNPSIGHSCCLCLIKPRLINPVVFFKPSALFHVFSFLFCWVGSDLSLYFLNEFLLIRGNLYEELIRFIQRLRRNRQVAL